MQHTLMDVITAAGDNENNIATALAELPPEETG